MLAKDEVIPALVAEWAALDELLTSLDESRWARQTALPGWTVQDVVAHVVGTECALAGQEAPPCEIDVRALPHVHNDMGVANEIWVESMRGERPGRVLERFREIIGTRRKALESLTQEDFDAPSWTPAGQRTYGRFMRIRLFDCWMHEQDIRDAVDLPGHDSGPCAEGAQAEIVEALGFLVGKRAGAPQGSSVTIELTGPVHATHHVAVDGRAALVDSLPGPATVTIRMSSNLLTRIAGGRVPVAGRLDEIGFDGDAELGTRVANALPFTM